MNEQDDATRREASIKGLRPQDDYRTDGRRRLGALTHPSGWVQRDPLRIWLAFAFDVFPIHLILC